MARKRASVRANKHSAALLAYLVETHPITLSRLGVVIFNWLLANQPSESL